MTSRQCIHEALFLALVAGLTGCAGTQSDRRGAMLHDIRVGTQQRFIQQSFGPPDLVATIPQLLERVAARPGHFVMPFAQRTLEFDDYRALTSFYLWHAIYPDNSPTDFDESWLDQFAYGNAVFWFYDVRPVSERSPPADTTSECYAFTFQGGICVSTFHFPWNLAALRASPAPER